MIHSNFKQQAEGHSSSNRTAALFIDVQSFDGMEREDAEAYKAALVKNIEELTARNIPVIWVAIAKGGAKLLAPQGIENQHEKYDLETLEEMGFTGHRPEHAHHDLYAELIAEHGPKKSDVVYRKPSMSALAEPTDTALRDDILEESGIKYISQRKENDHPDFRYIEPHEADKEFANLFAGQQTLANYLRDQEINRTIIFGAVSYYCVTKTAEDAHRKGFAPTIASDMVLSWKYPPKSLEDREKATLVWQAEEGAKMPFNHAALISEKAQQPLVLMPMSNAMVANNQDGAFAPVIA